MTNINSSHIFDDFIARRASVGQQQAETQQQETKPEGKKKINKALIGAAAAAGAAAIAFAGISMLRKGKMPEEVKKAVQSAEEFAQKANNTAEDVETISKKVDTLIDESVSPIISEEIRSIFEKGAENGYQDVVDENGNLLRRFELLNGTPQRLIEYGEDGGAVIRETGIKSLKDLNFEVHDKVNNKSIYFINGKPAFYYEGLEKLPDGTKRRAKELRIFDGKPYAYIEGWEKMPDGTIRTAKELQLENGKPYAYYEGWEKLPDDIERTAKRLQLENGKPKRYVEGLEHLPDGTEREAKELSFIDEKPSTYKEGIEESGKDGIKIAKEISLRDGKINRYEEGREQAYGVIKNAKKLEFKDGKPVNYSEGTKFDCETHDMFAQKKFIYVKYGRKKGWKEVKQD